MNDIKIGNMNGAVNSEPVLGDIPRVNENKYEELRKQFNELFIMDHGEFGKTIITEKGIDSVTDWWISKIEQIEKESYERGMRDTRGTGGCGPYPR